MADRLPVIPEIPENLPDYQLQILDALKEAVEVLTGQRGDGNLQVVAKGELTIQPEAETGYVVRARNIGVTISGQQLTSASEFGVLRNDVQALSNRLDIVANLLNALIRQLKETRQ